MTRPADFCLTCGGAARPACLLRRHRIEPVAFTPIDGAAITTDGTRATAPKREGRIAERGGEEIQLAHDQIATLILADLPGVVVTEENKKNMALALDVLCWVLDHNHNVTFAGNLETIKRTLEAAGYRVARLPRPMKPDEARREGYLGERGEEEGGEQ